MNKFKPHFCFLLLFLGFALNSISQITFVKNYDNYFTNATSNSLKQTSDGGYITTGFIQDSTVNNKTNIHLIKTNPSGDTTWMKTFFHSTESLLSYHVLSTSGGYTICGTISGINDDLLLIRTNSSGTILWSKTYGSSGNENGYCIQRTNDSGYVVCGSTTSFGSGLEDIYILKTDSSGNIQWTKTFGGNSSDIANYISQCSDLGYIVCGSTGSYGAGNNDCILLKLASNGTLQWSKVWGGINSDISNSVQQTSDLGYIVCGKTLSYGVTNGFGNTLENIYLNKFDNSGTMQWSKAYGDTAAQWGLSAIQLTGGRYALTGGIFNPQVGDYNPFLITTNSTGNILSQNIIYRLHLGEREQGMELIKTTDNGFAIAGDQFEFLFKTDSLGKAGCNDSTYNIIAVVAPNTTITPSPGISTGGTTNNITIQMTTGGVPQTHCILNSVNEFYKKDITVSFYPNPLNTSSTIEITDDIPISEGVVNFELYDVLGNTLIKKTFTEKKFIIEKGRLAPGIYIYHLIFGSRSHCGKIIVE